MNVKKTKNLLSFLLLAGLAIVFLFLAILPSAQAADNRRIQFSWEKNEDDTAYYRLYHGVVKGYYGESFETEAGFNSMIFDFGDFLACQHYFVVTAVDSAGNESSESNEIAIDLCGDGCGNGLVEPWLNEVCDGNGKTCLTNSNYRGESPCKADCSGWSSVCQATEWCGDNVVNGDESCEGSGSGIGCVLGLYTSTTTCSGCQLGTCNIGSQRCGNGILEGAEQCGDNGVTQAACLWNNIYPGTKTCNSSTCLWTSSCSKIANCGDGIKDQGEVCDRGDFGDETNSCSNWGNYDNGNVSCNNDCSGVNTSECSRCGDGQITNGETCETNGSYVGNKRTCQDWGYDGGSISCSGCSANTSACYNIINGACGNNLNQGLVSLSASDPENCSSGTVSNFVYNAASLQWTWTCLGDKPGHEDASCMARYSQDGVCGGAVNKINKVAPTTDLCQYGSAGNVVYGKPLADYYNWTCVGVNGGANTSCQASSCGDGVIGYPEKCDNNGNNTNSYTCAGYNKTCPYCDLNCQSKLSYSARCGDGIKQTQHGEICDDGPNNGAYNHCSTNCTSWAAKCGDNNVDTQFGEECDRGNQNGVKCDPTGGDCQYCNSSCKLVWNNDTCGTGTLEGDEVCDEGEAKNGVPCVPEGYDSSCKYCKSDCSGEITVEGPKCGDGVVYTEKNVISNFSAFWNFEDQIRSDILGKSTCWIDPDHSTVNLYNSTALGSTSLYSADFGAVYCNVDNYNNVFSDGVYSISFRYYGSGFRSGLQSLILSLNNQNLLYFGDYNPGSITNSSISPYTAGLATIVSNGNGTKLYNNNGYEVWSSTASIKTTDNLYISLQKFFIDNLIIWDRAISVDEIKALYAQKERPLYEVCDTTLTESPYCMMNGYNGQLSCQSDCTKLCTLTTYCGDGLKQASEICDPEHSLTKEQTCSSDLRTGKKHCLSDCSGYGDCVTSYCGDGNIDSGDGEECDEGDNNTNVACDPGESGCEYCNNSCELIEVSPYSSSCDPMQVPASCNSSAFVVDAAESNNMLSFHDCRAWCESQENTACCQFAPASKTGTSGVCTSFVSSGSNIYSPSLGSSSSYYAALCHPDGFCGNDVVEEGEGCDEGVYNGLSGHCSLDCTSARINNVPWIVAPVIFGTEHNQVLEATKWFCGDRPCQVMGANGQYYQGVIKTVTSTGQSTSLSCDVSTPGVCSVVVYSDPCHIFWSGTWFTNEIYLSNHYLYIGRDYTGTTCTAVHLP